MRIDQLDLNSKKSPKRAGRGHSAGRGKTAGRGTKGQNARSGGGVRLGFEGGQQPLMMRLPKQRGFKTPRPQTVTVTTDQLNALGSKTVTNDELAKAQLIASPRERVKIVLKSPVSAAMKVHVYAMSAGALKSLESAGGEFVKTDILSSKSSDTSK